MCRSWSPNRQTAFLLKFDLRDDDDEFLYGDSELKESSLSKVPPALLADLAVPSTGETPLLGPLVSSRRILYSTRPKRNIIDILLTSSLACVRQLNRMSKFNNLPTSPRTPLSFCIALLSIPFGKTEPADDDLFQTVHPPADATPPQAEDAEEAVDDADVDAVTGDGDGSDASEESEEVSSYMLHMAIIR